MFCIGIGLPMASGLIPASQNEGMSRFPHAQGWFLP